MWVTSRMLQPIPLSRRKFLYGLAGGVGYYALSGDALGQGQPVLPIFEEIPPSISGIR